MEVYIPIQDHSGPFGPAWGRGGLRGRSSLCHPADFWGRRGRGGCCFRAGSRPMIPRNLPTMPFAFDDMYLDNWISPADVFGSIFTRREQPTRDPANPAIREDSIEQQTPAEAATPTVVANKDLFEVKMNVTDYKPETLSVKVANGVITVEGQNEEMKTEKDEKGNEVVSEEFVSRQFKKIFTIPPNVIEEKLECKMTADGELVLSAPLKAIEGGPEQSAVRSISVTTEIKELGPSPTTPEEKTEAPVEPSPKENETTNN